MKKIIYFLLIALSSLKIDAQCFEIQSILVDACAGSQEGQNEMVIFKVGSVALNTSNLTVAWPNNSWLGITQNAGTAADVLTVNNTILGCGLLKEPVGGVLPANAKVLLVTSTAWNPLAQSFVNLSDTLYIIFQTAGNTAGHFANYASGGGLRTLTMTFSTPVGCTDAVTYDRGQLLNQSLVIGGQDGGAVDFNPAGIPTYVNRGCQAPYIPLNVDAGINKTICFNSAQNFTATTTSNFTSVLWSLGATASGSFSATNSLTTTYTPSISDNGTIKLYITLSKACGTQTTTVKDSVNLTILQLPQPVASAVSNSICSGQSTALSYSISNASSTGTTSVLWLPSNATTNTISVNTANIYSVQVTNACGNNTSTISISTVPLPSVTIAASGPTQFCSGGNVLLTASSNVGNYSWTGGVTTNTISINTSTSVVVTSSNTCGSAQATQTVDIIPLTTVTISPNNISICAGQSAIATASANTATTYTWSGTGVNGLNTNTVSLNTAGTYTVSGSNVCNTSTAQVVVTLNSTPSLSVASTSTLLCTGATATLSLAGSSGTYAWSGSSATTNTLTITAGGTYNATVTTVGCGSATTSITISSLQTPTLTVASNTAIICNNTPIVITASSTSTNYSWLPLASSANTLQVTSPAIYTVSSSNSCGSAIQTITVTSASTPSLTANPSATLVCPGNTVNITVSGGTGGYNWTGVSSTSSVVTVSSGVYIVSNTNSCGTGSQTITINTSTVSAGFSGNPLSGTVPLSVDFTNTAVGATSYTWNYGNNTSSTGATPVSQTYTATGTYTITQTVANSNGCLNSQSIIVVVQNEDGVFVIPNVFTPNNDSINDVFKINGTNISDFNCVIFDRWGLQMYEWSDIKSGWNGKVEGQSVPDGTYFYIINATDLNNKEVKKQGAFSLFK